MDRGCPLAARITINMTSSSLKMPDSTMWFLVGPRPQAWRRNPSSHCQQEPAARTNIWWTPARTRNKQENTSPGKLRNLPHLASLDGWAKEHVTAQCTRQQTAATHSGDERGSSTTIREVEAISRKSAHLIPN